MANLKFIDINKVYDENVEAVTNFNLEIEDGEFIVFLGPSGCGKSTTLRMVAGLEEITSGEIYINGELINHIHPKDRNIAMVFQNYALYPHMNVYDNISFGLKIRKIDKNEIDKKVKEAAKILELENELDRLPKALSGGQRQRVALGRAIVREPSVFLMDEPLSNLDARLRVQMRADLVNIHKAVDATTIYVTHDQVEAMTMASRIVIMHEGRIQQVGTPEEIYHQPNNAFVASFIGSPATNICNIEISEDEFIFGGINYPLNDELKLALKNENKAQIGIRPERFSLEKRSDYLKVPIELNRIEPLGYEYLLYGDFGGEQIIANIHADHLPSEKNKIDLYFNLDDAYFFHSENGKKLI